MQKILLLTFFFSHSNSLCLWRYILAYSILFFWLLDNHGFNINALFCRGNSYREGQVVLVFPLNYKLCVHALYSLITILKFECGSALEYYVVMPFIHLLLEILERREFCWWTLPYKKLTLRWVQWWEACNYLRWVLLHALPSTLGPSSIGHSTIEPFP